MRKPQAVGPSQGRSSLVPSNLIAVSLFALAYVAILGVLFAPEGYFLNQPASVVETE